MKAKKLSNLLEFKDREQVRGLLALASGRSEAAVNDILLSYIKNPKWALHGLAEGPVLQGLIGLRLLEKKEAEIQYLAVRPENDIEKSGAELIVLVREKYKLKKIFVEAEDERKALYEKLGFEAVGEEGPRRKFFKTYS